MAKKIMYAGIGIVLVVAFFFLFRPGVSGYATLDNFGGEITLYKSMSCGCCGVFSDYLVGKGNLNVNVKVVDDVEPVKDEYNIPNQLRTCHTTILDGYFVEGHIPLEAINKLLEERPDIVGIALPGMPAGSPGMMGTKAGDWVIYGVNHDGSYFEWMVV